MLWLVHRLTLRMLFIVGAVDVDLPSSCFIDSLTASSFFSSPCADEVLFPEEMAIVAATLLRLALMEAFGVGMEILSLLRSSTDSATLSIAIWVEAAAVGVVVADLDDDSSLIIVDSSVFGGDAMFATTAPAADTPS